MSNQPALDVAHAEAVKCLTALKEIVVAADNPLVRPGWEETFGRGAQVLRDFGVEVLLKRFQAGQESLQESLAAMEKVYPEARRALVKARQRLVNKPQPVSVGKLSAVFAHELVLKLARALRQPAETMHDIGETLCKLKGPAGPTPEDIDRISLHMSAGVASCQDLEELTAKADGEYLDAVAALQVEGGGEGATTSPHKPTECVFARSGDGYDIAAFGERGHFREIVGFEHLEKLLRNAGNPMLMVELIGGGQDDRIDADDHSWQPVLDEEAKRDYREQLRELNDGIEKAKRDNDDGEQERLETEKADVESDFLAAYGLGGQDRDINNPIDKLRPRIHMALGRAYKALKEGNPSLSKLADHLEANISSEGATFKYAPTPLPDWSFDQE